MVSLLPKILPLDEKRVLDAAFKVIEAHGFEGLTIRRIAGELGVKNPALYWHFKNKQEIIDGMAGRLLDTMTARPLVAADWRGWLGGAARWYRSTLLGVRDGAELLSNANLARSRHFTEFERGIGFLASRGFSERDALLGLVTVFDYTLGVTYAHQADRRITQGQNSVGAAIFAPLGGLSPDAARDALFEGGLELILDGLTQRRGR